MTLENDFESVITEELEWDDGCTLIIVKDKIPPLFYGRSIEIDGETTPLVEDECDTLIPRGMIVPGTGGFIGKKIRMDKKDFHRC